MNLIQVFKMLRILLFLSFTKIKANSVNNLPTNLERLWIKFRLSEKHTKFEKILLMVWTFTLSKCTKHEEDCADFCVLLRKSELYEIQK